MSTQPTYNTKFLTSVTAIGEQVEEFVRHQILVLFQVGAPEELAVFSVLHQPTVNKANIEAGDVLWLGTASYRILAVGEVANRNLESLGHLVVKFNGRKEPELPGDVCVEQKPLVALKVGDEIRIES